MKTNRCVAVLDRPRSLFGSALSEVQRYHDCKSLIEFLTEGVERRPSTEKLVCKLDMLRRRMECRLDKYSLISTDRADRELLEEARSLKRVILQYSGAEYLPEDAHYFALLKERSKKARYEEHVTRIVWEFEARIDWYPVFVTLTVREEHYREVFSRGCDAWRNYHRSVTRSVKQALGLRTDSSYIVHTFVAVVERGGKTGRLHIHCLHFLKKLPIGSDSDPNVGCGIPYRRELRRWNVFWPYGFASAIAVRTGAMDIYARRGWRWPVERTKDGKSWKAIEGKGTGAVAGYMGKYLKKERKEPELWRTRMSRNFGTTVIVKKMRKLKIRRLWTIVNQPLPMVRRTGRLVPKQMMRRLAVKEMTIRFPKTLTRMSCSWEVVRLRTLRERMERSKRMIMRTSIQTLSDTDDFEWYRDLLKKATVIHGSSGLARIGRV